MLPMLLVTALSPVSNRLTLQQQRAVESEAVTALLVARVVTVRSCTLLQPGADLLNLDFTIYRTGLGIHLHGL